MTKGSMGISKLRAASIDAEFARDRAKLRDENRRLRNALQSIAKECDGPAAIIARTALQ